MTTAAFRAEVADLCAKIADRGAGSPSRPAAPDSRADYPPPPQVESGAAKFVHPRDLRLGDRFEWAGEAYVVAATPYLRINPASGAPQHVVPIGDDAGIAWPYRIAHFYECVRLLH
jgi:hypothetical protein